MTYRLHAGQQVGATLVPRSSHLHTRREAALQFHAALAHRFQLLSNHLTALSVQGAVVDPAARAEVERRVRFQQSRAALLSRPRAGRLLPALMRLADYHRYEKGMLSLLRDLAHTG